MTDREPPPATQRQAFGTIESVFGAVLLLAALVLFLTGSGFRLIGISAGGGWIEEVTVYLVVWGVLLAASSVVAHNENVRVDIFLRLMGPRMRRRADILASLSGAAFCLVLAWFGWKVAEFSVLLDERGPSFLQIPMVWYYAALPVSMLLCGCRYVVELTTILRSDGQTGSAS